MPMRIFDRTPVYSTEEIFNRTDKILDDIAEGRVSPASPLPTYIIVGSPLSFDTVKERVSENHPVGVKCLPFGSFIREMSELFLPEDDTRYLTSSQNHTLAYPVASRAVRQVLGMSVPPSSVATEQICRFLDDVSFWEAGGLLSHGSAEESLAVAAAEGSVPAKIVSIAREEIERKASRLGKRPHAEQSAALARRMRELSESGSLPPINIVAQGIDVNDQEQLFLLSALYELPQVRLTVLHKTYDSGFSLPEPSARERFIEVHGRHALPFAVVAEIGRLLSEGIPVSDIAVVSSDAGALAKNTARAVRQIVCASESPDSDVPETARRNASLLSGTPMSARVVSQTVSMGLGNAFSAVRFSLDSPSTSGQWRQLVLDGYAGVYGKTSEKIAAFDDPREGVRQVIADRTGRGEDREALDIEIRDALAAGGLPEFLSGGLLGSEEETEEVSRLLALADLSGIYERVGDDDYSENSNIAEGLASMDASPDGSVRVFDAESSQKILDLLAENRRRYLALIADLGASRDDEADTAPSAESTSGHQQGHLPSTSDFPPLDPDDAQAYDALAAHIAECADLSAPLSEGLVGRITCSADRVFSPDPDLGDDSIAEEETIRFMDIWSVPFSGRTHVIATDLDAEHQNPYWFPDAMNGLERIVLGEGADAVFDRWAQQALEYVSMRDMIETAEGGISFICEKKTEQGGELPVSSVFESVIDRHDRIAPDGAEYEGEGVLEPTEGSAARPVSYSERDMLADTGLLAHVAKSGVAGETSSTNSYQSDDTDGGGSADDGDQNGTTEAAPAFLPDLDPFLAPYDRDELLSAHWKTDGGTPVFSPSELEKMSSCPRKWLFSNQAAGYRTDWSDSYRTAVGKFVHAAMKQFYDARREEGDEEFRMSREKFGSERIRAAVSDAVSKSVAQVTRDNPGIADLPEMSHSEKVLRNVEDKVLVLLHVDCDFLPGFRPLAHEVDVFADLGEYALRGTVDRIDVRPNANGGYDFVVIDYKNNVKSANARADSKYSQKDFKKSDFRNIGSRKIQVALYALALMKEHPDWKPMGWGYRDYKADTSYIHREFALDSEIAPMDTVELDSPEAVLEELAKAIGEIISSLGTSEEAAYYPKNTAPCQYCDQKVICPIYGMIA